MSFQFTYIDAVEIYAYALDLCKDSSTSPSDYGIVAVLDGGFSILFIPETNPRNPQIYAS